MQATEWTPIVDRLNASFPGQALRAETAAQWFEELSAFDSGEVWLAVQRVRREQANMPRSVATFLDAIDANDSDQRRAAADPATATRVCGTCATSPIEGQLPRELEPGTPDNPYRDPLVVWVPCPACRPVRARVLARGGNHAMTLKTDRDGWPEGWRREPATTEGNRA